MGSFKSLWTLLIGLSALHTVLGQGSDSIKITRIDGPTFAERGQDVTLVCIYDLGECSLFSIEWLFNGTNILTHRDGYGSNVPDNPDERLVNVNVSASTNNSIVISQARIRDSGRYTCKIKSKAPEFYPSSYTHDLTVGVFPDDPPTVESPLETDKDVRTRKAGDEVYFVCVSPPSHPASTLTWLINGKKVGDEHTQAIDVPRTDELITTKLALNITLEEAHFKKGQVALECISSVFNFKNNFTRNLSDPDYKPVSSSAGDSKTKFFSKGGSPLFGLRILLQLLVLFVASLLW